MGMYFTLIVYIIGGTGLFILGMILMTDALKNLAGDRLRSALSRFTGGRASSIFTGIGITALMQSSHATIITTIGFVSAGLITFEQSIGIVLGAHIGTTSTGWLVSLLGLKFKMALISLPALGIGAVMRLSSKERLIHIGMILAGFGLIFLGIDTLQTGMKDLAGTIDLTSFTVQSLSGRSLLVGTGLLMTVLMQSSSAALTMTLTALNAGSLSLEQSAVLVIGINVGTTLTAAIAALGASVSAKRTAASHIVFNVTTAIIIFLIFPFFIRGITFGMNFLGTNNPTIILPAFHTIFNVVGMCIALPFIKVFIRMCTILIPEEPGLLTRNIDFSVTSVPAVAVETARRTSRDIIVASIDTIKDLLTRGHSPHTSHSITAIDAALVECRLFLSRIQTKGSSGSVRHRLVSVLHVIDHAENLTECAKESDHIKVLIENESFSTLTKEFCGKLDVIRELVANHAQTKDLLPAENTSTEMTEIRKKKREQILSQTADGLLSPTSAYEQIEAVRWLDRVAYYIWRSVHHVGEYETAEKEKDYSPKKR